MTQEQQGQQQSEEAPATEQNGNDGNSGSAPSDPPSEVKEASTSASEGTSAPESWNGELETLESSEWYKALPEQHRGLVKEGLKSKLGNYERGYQQKFQDVAKQRDHLEKEIRAERERIQNMLYGMDDPTKDVRSELERAVKDKQELETKLAEIHRKQEETRVDEIVQWVEQNAKDVYESDAAWDAFVKANQAGFSKEDSLKMASALLEKKPAPQVPDSIAMMNNNSAASGTESKSNDDYETVRRRLLAQS
jgi:hypothetical protein